MGVLDELRREYGDDLGRPKGEGAQRGVHWVPLCVCGHIAKYHPSTIGGQWEVPDEGSRSIAGQEVRTVHTATGCVGAMPLKDFETEAISIDREANVMTIDRVPTCPCREMRAIADIDRPNRYWNQRVFADRHPFMVGARAFSVHLSKLKIVRESADPEARLARLYDERFTWREEARRCSISSCKATGDGVWPVFVNDELLSELRCEKHR